MELPHGASSWVANSVISWQWGKPISPFTFDLEAPCERAVVCASPLVASRTRRAGGLKACCGRTSFKARSEPETSGFRRSPDDRKGGVAAHQPIWKGALVSCLFRRVNWTISLALGMWSCVLLDGALPALYFTLALLMSALSHRQWKDAWKWVVFGWCISWAALKLEAEHASPPPSSASATWLLLRPRFLPSIDNGKVPTSRSRGFWDFVDNNGRRGRVWMTAKWEGDAARWGLVVRRNPSL